ncbi:hypothetical protein DdX_04743 [Ditylenchus destructor]|uniref:Uncharacterized protein n=1 Tax=Ditylenchus destructor TaxID=166010 RepID=A0AAD4RA24_9BILA|nr:hypothetical protein DdX_04743 [Ditylenchus destructor]
MAWQIYDQATQALKEGRWQESIDGLTDFMQIKRLDIRLAKRAHARRNIDYQHSERDTITDVKVAIVSGCYNQEAQDTLHLLVKLDNPLPKPRSASVQIEEPSPGEIEGDKCCLEGKFSNAVIEYSIDLEVFKEALSSRSIAYLNLGRITEAYDDASASLTFFEHYQKGWAARVYALFKKGNESQAVFDLLTLVRMEDLATYNQKTRDLRSLNREATRACSNQEYALARQYVENVLEKDDQNIKAKQIKSYTLAVTKEIEQALTVLMEVLLLEVDAEISVELEENQHNQGTQV